MDAIEPYAEACQHPESVYVFRVIKGGARQYGQQCLTCGRFQIMRKSAIHWSQQLQPFDQTLADNYEERRRRCYERRFQQAQGERLAKAQEDQQAWWDAYAEYLESDQWREKRQRVLARDNFMCQACHRRRATQVHHLTYRHVRNEPLFDLASICDVCHRSLTQLDRQQDR